MARSVQSDDNYTDDDTQYRMSSCSQCGLKARYNHLHRVTLKEKSGSSSGSSMSIPVYFNDVGKRRYAGSRRNSSRTYYRYVDKRLCEGCYRGYLRWQKIKYGFYTVVIGIIVLYAAVNHHASPAPAPSLNTDSPSSGGWPVQQLVAPTQQPLDQGDQSEGPRFQGDQPSPDLGPPAPQTPSPNNASDQPVAPAKPQEMAPEQVMTVTYLANVRSAPNGPKVGEVQAGEQLAVVQTEGKWAEVRRGDEIIGWVHRSLLAP